MVRPPAAGRRTVTVIVATPRTPPMGVSRSVILALDNDTITIVPVMSRRKQSKELISNHHGQRTLIQHKRQPDLRREENKKGRGGGGTGTYKSEKEQKDVDDAERKTRFQHRTRLVRIQAPTTPTLPSIVPEGPQIEVEPAGREVCAVRPRDAAQLVHARDQRAHEGQVDQGHEQSAVPGSQVVEEREERPCPC